MKLIAPSILSADFSRLGEEIKAAEKAGADLIHIDVMDGHFVPNITIGPLIVEAVKKVTDLPLDVHLMIENPDLYIKNFADAGADMISVHAEACTHLNRTLNLIKSFKKQAGIALNPATSINEVKWVLEYTDFIVLMTVNPGFGGQSFISNSIDKIKDVKQMLKNKGLKVLIQVDGGVNENTIEDISNAGVDIFVAGSAVFNGSDYKKNIDKLKSKL
jgi:ribulose-phosphate 3-epimerase